MSYLDQMFGKQAIYQTPYTTTYNYMHGVTVEAVFLFSFGQNIFIIINVICQHPYFTEMFVRSMLVLFCLILVTSFDSHCFLS